MRPSDAIWWHRSGSTLPRVMACCLTAPSHYLNQCWLIISKVLWHSSEGNFVKIPQPPFTEVSLKNYLPIIKLKAPRGQWVNAMELSLSCTNPSIYASVNQAIIGSENSLSPALHQAIICTNVDSFLNRALRNRFKWKLNQNTTIFLPSRKWIMKRSFVKCSHFVSVSWCMLCQNFLDFFVTWYTFQ